MPDELKGWLKSVAAENQRSLNGEVLVRLEASRKADVSKAQKGGAVLAPTNTAPMKNPPRQE